jgi:anaerobic ribonucleoside-triphosphate reductase activating protein
MSAKLSPEIEERLDLAGHAFPVEGLGPGRRVAIWVRGCGIGCPGCMTPELWDKGDTQTHLPVSHIAEVIGPLLDGADGLTISGGEPMDQPRSLAALLRVLRRERDVEVLVYSGYSLEDLQKRGGDTQELLEAVDLLIDRPFAHTAPNSLQWRGSDNQRVHLLSQRAQKYVGVKDAPMPEQRQLQLQILGAARYRIIGIPKRGDLRAYRAAMQARGLSVRPDTPMEVKPPA